MKTYIYISGLVAAFLLLGWLLALGLGMPRHLLMLAAGSIVFLCIYLPLVIRKRKMHRQRMKEIVQNYQNQKEQESDTKLQNDPGKGNAEEMTNGVDKENNKNKGKGWSMNNSPFRERNSGVTWGGGNIHAANASRGTRKGRK